MFFILFDVLNIVFYNEKYVFDRVNVFLCPWTHQVHSLEPISEPCSMEKYPPSRMANRYTRIFDAG